MASTKKPDNIPDVFNLWNKGMAETWLVPDTKQKRLVFHGPKGDLFQYLH